MELFEELNHNPSNFDNVTGLYINNPNRMSYLVFHANQKKEIMPELSPEISQSLDLIISLINDYMKGNYKKIPIRTLTYLTSALIYFVYPKQSFLDNIPGVKVIKKIGLLRLVIGSFQKDLKRYEHWRNNQEVIEV